MAIDIEIGDLTRKNYKYKYIFSGDGLYISVVEFISPKDRLPDQMTGIWVRYIYTDHPGMIIGQEYPVAQRSWQTKWKPFIDMGIKKKVIMQRFEIGKA